MFSFVTQNKKMDHRSFKRRIQLLSKIDCSKRKGKKFLLECKDTTLHGLSELCWNILRKEKNIPLNKRTLKKMLPLRRYFHRLSNPNGSIKNKRLLLSLICDKFLPILRKSIIPTLSRLYLMNTGKSPFPQTRIQSDSEIE